MNVKVSKAAQAEKARARQRFVIAGVGGVMPVLLNLVVIDLQTILLGATALTIASYLIRAVALFALGGLIGWLHRNEVDPVKLFQLGIAAPALITAAINGGRVALPDAPPAKQAAVWEIVATAIAQPPVGTLKEFSLPVETSAQQIYRGLFGALPKNIWFVISGSHLERGDAERQAAEIRRRGFPADVYAPYGGNPYYAVVIGAQITRDEALALQRRAVAGGLPKDTYLWTFPQRY